MHFLKRGDIVAGWLIPDAVFEHFYDVTPQYLLSCGIRALIIDIDNTLAPYEVTAADERTLLWFASLSENGINAALISNNGRERVELFNRALGVPAYYKSGKPLAKNFKRAMAEMGSDKTNTAVLGDQILTDVLGGKHIGLRAFLVPPIKDRTSAFFRFKRSLEVPAVRKYLKAQGNNASLSACDFWISKKFNA